MNNNKLNWWWQTRATRSEVKVPKPGTTQYVTYDFLVVFYNNFVPKMQSSRDIRLRKMLWPWNLGQSSLKVIAMDMNYLPHMKSY